jgi:tetraacyldisaccharide 4'-kinase
MSRDVWADRLRAGIPALTPLSWVYRAGLGISRETGLARRGDWPAPPRIVSVGNLEVGGSGKTPLAMLLLDAVRAAGGRAAYVGRGYGAPAGRGPLVSVVTAAGETPRLDVPGVRWIDREATTSLGDLLGDEAAVVAARCRDAMVAVSRWKRDAVAAVTAAGASAVIVDDAFQTWVLPRHRDVVLLDAERPFGNGRMLPAGPLREAPGALARADVVVFNGAKSEAELDGLKQQIERHLRPDAAVLGLTRRVRVEAVDPVSLEGPVWVACGVARPDRVERDVAATGLTVAGMSAFRDHHAFGERDVRDIESSAVATGARCVVVTEKDAVKLERFAWTLPVAVARLDVALIGGGAETILGTGNERGAAESAAPHGPSSEAV